MDSTTFCDSFPTWRRTDSVSATLKPDEAADQPFKQGGNTITVRECFTATVTSQ